MRHARQQPAVRLYPCLAFTSLLAIVALLAGRYLGWVWLDPTMGIVGAVVIGRWWWSLMRDTSAVLLVLGSLLKRRDRFDRVLLETPGLANPGPVAQTFFVDDDVREHYALDGIVTLVDARHLPLHLDESEEAREQVAFADVIVLNKQDLVSEPDLDKLERRVRAGRSLTQTGRSPSPSRRMRAASPVSRGVLTANRCSRHAMAACAGTRSI